jgi:glutathione S-transferase
MITLYQFEISPFCDKIRRALHWKGQPYQIREISIRESLTELKKINPAGKLPCLEHHGRFVADSTEIIHYLEETWPDPPLLPEDPAQLALCHLLEDWADESLYFYEMRLRFTLSHNAQRWIPELLAHDGFAVRTVGPCLVPRAMSSVLDKQGVGRKPLDAVLRDVQRHLDAVSNLLGERDWLVGEALSLADIAVFAQLHCIRGTDEGGKLIGNRAGLSAWMERVDRATEAPE